ncbi:MAG: UDP-N-acetylmuramate--L-alanine ligase [Nitrospiraceae bacterium]|nr:MAG: UDP-N-acetylmuramate--L-alanine ligase [Nitrospiraceae bacterium]
MYKRFEKVHFVGIGGVGMSGIAEVLHNLGYEVEGSDLKGSETTKRLAAMGISINIGHREENVKKADVVVISSAVNSSNPEVEAARKLKIPVIPRAEMLAELARLKYGVLVAGAHGKTTTTSLVASLLGEGKLDPTVVVGGKLKGIGSNAKLGWGEFLVAEADESDGSFLKLSPTIAVVTNIDREHMDYFKSIEEIKAAFLSFVNKVPFYGLSILCGDNEHIKELMPKIQRRFITYGLGDGMDLTARGIRTEGLSSIFEAVLNGRSLGSFKVPLIGRHNVSNCLAAIAVANELKVSMDIIRGALGKFSGVQRRFELKGTADGINVVDDYGHHPAEIMATLKAAKEAIIQNTEQRTQNTESAPHSPLSKGGQRGGIGGRLVVLFQPHRYTRTRDLLNEFIDAFTEADKVILMDIYPAGEKPLPGVHSELLCKGIKDTGKDIDYIADRGAILDYLDSDLKEADTLLTLGAGDVWKLGEEFLENKGKGHKVQG